MCGIDTHCGQVAWQSVGRWLYERKRLLQFSGHGKESFSYSVSDLFELHTHTHTNLVHLQIVCGPDFEFYEMISRWPGATHENKIFNISEVYQRFEYNQIGGVLLADHNYNTRSFVMTPIDSPHTANEWRYNEAHSGTYTVPAAIDLWKRRFKCLQTVINNAEGM